MEIWHSLLLGTIQGATEFLPVSSSGHLFLAEIWLGLTPNINFSILLHVATLLAVVVVYRADLLKLFQGALIYWQCPAHKYKKEGKLAWQLMLATVFTVGVVLLIEPYFENLLVLPWIAGTLIVTGVLIVVAEKFHSNQVPHFTWTLAVILGLVQGLAVIPGISRSGLTIAFLILLGLNRQLAVKLSFLLSIPTILGALVFMLKDQWENLAFGLSEAAGFVVAFVVALVAIWGMKNLVEKHWIWFAPYCVVLGGGILIYIFVSGT